MFTHHRFQPGVLKAVAVVVALAALAGCAGNSQLVNLWKDPEHPKAPLSNLLVICMKNDVQQRRIWEDVFAYELSTYGVRATPSYNIFPAAIPDTQQVVAAVRANGYDGVVIAQKLRTVQNQYYVPGYVTTVPVTAYSPWYGAYGTYWHQSYQPGYVATDRIVRYQVDVWSTADRGRLVWIGGTETLNPNSRDEVRDTVARMVAPELKRAGVIGKAK